MDARGEKNQKSLRSTVLAYVLRVVWWLWSTANLFKCSNGLWYRRQLPRLVNRHSIGLVANLVNTLPKRPPYAIAFNMKYGTHHHPISCSLLLRALWYSQSESQGLYTVVGKMGSLFSDKCPADRGRYWPRQSKKVRGSSRSFSAGFNGIDVVDNARRVKRWDMGNMFILTNSTTRYKTWRREVMR